ncbi:MAG TPA: hypothetical protein VEI46_10105 [Thermodesulfovibrionales bacterium]|nr:hypothetical protein [Thermodesulfovibrionales bacterium]
MNVLKKTLKKQVFRISGLVNSDCHVRFSLEAFMKRLSCRAVLTALPALLLIISSGCATGQALSAVKVQGIEGANERYTLILYREEEYFGLKTIAFLVPEGNGYSLQPYAPEYNYTTIHNISGQEGLQLAVALFHKNRDYVNYEIRRISDPGGGTVGFEIRPLYDATVEGRSDVMRVEYGLSKGGAVNVYIHLNETSMEGSVR